MEVGAVVVAGGRAARLDGVDKAGIELRGRTLLERALAALGEVDEVVVVGERVPTSRPVIFTREHPAYGGPAAGLLAGVAAFPSPPELIVALAVDMPGVSPATIRRLMLAADRDGALLVDAEGRRQYLCGVYATAPLLAAAPEQADGLPMGRLLESLRLTEVPAVGRESHDVDTWEQLRDLRD